MKARHFFIVILMLISAYFIYEDIGATNWYSFLIEAVFWLPVPLGLFFLSKFSKNKDVGWLLKLDVAGMWLAVLNILVSIAVLVRELVDYF